MRAAPAAALFAVTPAFAADFAADLDPVSHDNALRRTKAKGT
jgi:hypothetical protein